jgi:hypothetical protein
VPVSQYVKVVNESVFNLMCTCQNLSCLVSWPRYVSSFMFAILHVCSDFQEYIVCALQEVLELAVCM